MRLKFVLRYSVNVNLTENFGVATIAFAIKIPGGDKRQPTILVNHKKETWLVCTIPEHP